MYKDNYLKSPIIIFLKSFVLNIYKCIFLLGSSEIDLIVKWIQKQNYKLKSNSIVANIIYMITVKIV